MNLISRKQATFHFALVLFLVVSSWHSRSLAAELNASSVAQKDSATLLKLTQTRNRIHFSYEQVNVGQNNQRLGLFGASYLVDLPTSAYGGISVYSAVNGDLGGFFTGGFSAGWRPRITEKTHIDLGLFIGGGGGGAAPQGGGLMLRPHIGVDYDFGNYQLGLQYSRVHFPNGEIDSRQIVLALAMPFQSLFLDRGETTDRNIDDSIIPSGLRAQVGFQRNEIGLLSTTYVPDSDVRNTSGQLSTKNVNLLGFSYRHYFKNRWYYSVDAAGAAGGEADGYAELLGGVGYRFPLGQDNRAAITTRIALGSAGGGLIDTGGGFIGKVGIGAEYRLTRHLTGGIDYGLIDSAGSFRAKTLDVYLSYAMNSLVFVREPQPMESTDSLQAANWRIRTSVQTYREPQRKTVTQQNIDLLSLKIDRSITPSVYLTGQASGAFDGDAGGYAVGLVGAGWQSQAFNHLGWVTQAELLIGASGGGSIDVGGGAMAQPMVGIGYHFTRSLGLHFMAGRVKSFHGNLDVPVYDLGISYRFSTVER